MPNVFDVELPEWYHKATRFLDAFAEPPELDRMWAPSCVPLEPYHMLVQRSIPCISLQGTLQYSVRFCVLLLQATSLLLLLLLLLLLGSLFLPC